MNILVQSPSALMRPILMGKKTSKNGEFFIPAQWLESSYPSYGSPKLYIKTVATVQHLEMAGEALKYELVLASSDTTEAWLQA